MAKSQQRSSKEAKKPKQDKATKPISSSAVTATKQTVVAPKGKTKS